MNGRKGRARILTRIKRERLREAAADGVDITDRQAVRAYQERKSLETYDRIRREISKC